MADMRDFGEMDADDKGGVHDYSYEDTGAVDASPGLTPSQTVGPFFAYGLTPGPYGYAFPEIHKTDLAGADVAGERIEIIGHVFDRDGVRVHDAVIEIVQADASGTYVHAPRNDGFTGFGRCGTGAQGKDADTHFKFRTVKPGASQRGAAPFVTLIVTMRGLLNHMITRMYFPEDDLARDPVIAQVPETRRGTLVAKNAGPGRYRFDIRMQGPEETVFFDL
ncbi:MAG: protocatechuate 3,4-dioxygenase subunit alpha [Aliishimia sp.]